MEVSIKPDIITRGEGIIEEEEEASKNSQLNENVEFDAKNEWKKNPQTC